MAQPADPQPSPDQQRLAQIQETENQALAHLLQVSAPDLEAIRSANPEDAGKALSRLVGAAWRAGYERGYERGRRDATAIAHR